MVASVTQTLVKISDMVNTGDIDDLLKDDMILDEMNE